MKSQRLLLLVLGIVLSVGCGGSHSGSTCTPAMAGTVGCKCLTNQSCKVTPSGAMPTCTKGTCELPACEPGTPKAAGCNCAGAGECAAGMLCYNNRCEADTGQTLSAPVNPTCMTPCKGGSITRPDGVTIQCNQDGLLQGCLSNTVCQLGTCVTPPGAASACVADTDCTSGQSCSGGACRSACRTNGECAVDQHCDTGLCVDGAPPSGEEPGACSTDGQCPQFQTCIALRCYSDCATDADCRNGRVCFQQVCRVQCDVTPGDTCPVGSSCTQADSTRSFCMPLDLTSQPGGSTDEPLPPNETGSFVLSTQSLKPLAQQNSVSFTIANHFSQTKTFTVRKFKHTEVANGKETSDSKTPMFWVSLGATSGGTTVAPAVVPELTIDIAPQATATIVLGTLTNAAKPHWVGSVSVSTANQNAQFVDTTVIRSPEGQWTGTAWYLANFGTEGLDAWVANRDDLTQLSLVGNALVRRWGALRGKLISLKEFEASLTSVLTGSWRWASVQANCPEAGAPNANVGCYPFDNSVGHSVFSDFLPSNPIPSGVVEFPIVLDMHAQDASKPGIWSGRVVSKEALEFAGDPAVAMRFADDPGKCTSAPGEPCVTMLNQFDFTALVGGRFDSKPGDTGCAGAPTGPGTYDLKSTPWLVAGFSGGTSADSTGQRFRYECRDKARPFGLGSGKIATNEAMAESNPVPDGQPRVRRISLLDGAIVNTDTLIVLFREQFPSFLDAADTEGFSQYGIMELHRANAVLQPSDYLGSTVSSAPPAPSAVLAAAPACKPEMLAPFGGTVDATNWYKVAEGLLSGVTSDATPVPIAAPELAHYLCKDNDLFDSGPATTTPIACPAGSEVTFFTLSDGTDLTQLDCQKGASCAGASCSCTGVLKSWIDSNQHGIRLDGLYSRCADQLHCDTNRYDLRAGRTFYKSSPDQTWDPIDLSIDSAFRYKTKYVNHTTGSTVGFAPQPCVPNSTLVPYCYDASSIETIESRIDCAINIYVKYHATTDPAHEVEIANAKTDLHDYLVRSFSYSTSPPGSVPLITHAGFESLNAELLVMLGDEAFTNAFASRFDLAGLALGDFRGDKFEPNGLSLSGGAGYEFYELYQAAQYYRLAVERFYKLSGTFWQSLKVLSPQEAFITTKSVASYFTKLIKASANETTVWSAVAKRYQALGRADLARLVVEREYTSAHLESIALSRMMLKVLDVASSAEQAQIVSEVEHAQDTYTAALMDMASVYKDITDNVDYFGLAAGYVPFPVLYPADANAFEKMKTIAETLLVQAKDKEDLALADKSSFATSAAAFQSQLAGISNDYDSQLADICGSFTIVQNGQTAVVPATMQYAYLTPQTARLGDPCGMVGNGQLFDSLTSLNLATLDVQSVQQSLANLQASITDASDRAKKQCVRLGDFESLVVGNQTQALTLRNAVAGVQTAMEIVQRAQANARAVLDFAKCSVGTSTDCPSGFAAAITYGGLSVVTDIALDAGDITVAALNGQIGSLELSTTQLQLGQECAALQIDLEFTLKGLLRQAIELNIEALKVQQNVALARSRMQKLRNQSVMLQKQETQVSDMAIDVEASRSDPNVRVYRNDTVIAADRTFNSALQAAYKLTRIYEYYTSQSYADVIKLKLVRMVGHGDYSLESYVANLEASFETFQETYGAADTRVAIVSVKDDIFGAPNLGNNTTALAQNTRKQSFTEWLTDATRLDDRGYITIPFTTTLGKLSPLTRNHKILKMQVDISGGNIGDPLGRVYVTQKGTSTIYALDGRSAYYAFPTDTAVVNTKFNGTTTFTSDVYDNFHLRDRPLVNDQWQLVINAKDEDVNRDIDLTSLTDIKLIIYYTDFVSL